MAISKKFLSAKFLSAGLFVALVLSACGAAPAVNAPPVPTKASEPAKAEAPTAAPEAAKAAEQPAASGAKGKFRVWKQFGDGDDILKQIMAPWLKEQGLELELTSSIDDVAKILAAISAGDPPDLLILSGPDNVGTWSREKLLLPLDDVIKTAGMDVNTVFTGPLATCRYAGALYCLPWGTDVYALMWNKDLFKEAGLDPEKPPTTLEEMESFADKLTKTDKDGNITQIGFVPNFSWSHLDTYSMLFGGAYASADGAKITINSPEVIQALQWQAKYFHKYGTDKVQKFVSGFGEYSSPQNGFYSGKVAMQFEGEWQPTFMKRANVTLNYGVAAPPVPAANPERKGTVVVAGTVMAVPAGVKNVELSAKAFAFLQGDKQLADFMTANGNLPTTNTSAKDARFREGDKFVVWLDLLAGANAKAQTLTVINGEVNTALGEAEENSIKDPNFDLKGFLDKKAKELQGQLDKAVAK